MTPENACIMEAHGEANRHNAERDEDNNPTLYADDLQWMISPPFTSRLDVTGFHLTYNQHNATLFNSRHPSIERHPPSSSEYEIYPCRGFPSLGYLDELVSCCPFLCSISNTSPCSRLERQRLSFPFILAILSYMLIDIVVPSQSCHQLPR